VSALPPPAVAAPARPGKPPPVPIQAVHGTSATPVEGPAGDVPALPVPAAPQPAAALDDARARLAGALCPVAG
jgi:hypothetical protein